MPRSLSAIQIARYLKKEYCKAEYKADDILQSRHAFSMCVALKEHMAHYSGQCQAQLLLQTSLTRATPEEEEGEVVLGDGGGVEDRG